MACASCLGIGFVQLLSGLVVWGPRPNLLRGGRVKERLLLVHVNKRFLRLLYKSAR